MTPRATPFVAAMDHVQLAMPPGRERGWRKAATAYTLIEEGNG